VESRAYKIAPSILSADMSKLGEQVAEAEAGGADCIHVDVMDGHFVPNITVGPFIVEAVRRCTTLPLDVHLMVTEPERHLAAFGNAGADSLTVHVETCPHLNNTVARIKELGCRAGVSLNPSTALVTLEEIVPDVDMVLVMTVNPGFGGQAFLKNSPPRIRRVRAMLDQAGSSAALAVDGGIGPDTARYVVEAGADLLVAGSAVFRARVGIREAIARIRDAG